MEATTRGRSQLGAPDAPIDLRALVHRAEVFRRAQAVALGAAVVVLLLLGGHAATGRAVLVPLLCLAATTGLGATYVATRLACAPLPRVRR